MRVRIDLLLALYIGLAIGVTAWIGQGSPALPTAQMATTASASEPADEGGGTGPAAAPAPSVAVIEPTPDATVQNLYTPPAAEAPPAAPAAAPVASAPPPAAAAFDGNVVTGGGYSTAIGSPHGLQPVDAPSPVVSRLRVPSVSIDAPVVTGYLDSRTDQMLATRGAWTVGWYDYSAVPGHGNAVFAGHVDYINIGPAVLYNLRYLQVGAGLQVELTDGSVVYYVVQSNQLYSAASESWGTMFSPSDGDEVTMYTCDGSFNAGNGDYSERRIVRAVRVQ
jgi:LPXTG-site transpeptidase (sortase) family protein